MGLALQLTGIALGVLFLIALLFVGLVRGLERLASIGNKREKEKTKRAVIAAAVTSYLEEERLCGKGSRAANFKEQGGECGEKI